MRISRCWQVLELSPEADERSIKRQYARLLKRTRPDEDPVAFQRLREAYEEALQSAREARTEATVALADAVPPICSRSTVPKPAAPSEHEQALALLAALDDGAVERTWYEAKAKGIERALEPLLFRRCLEAATAHPNLLRWGVEQRQWLTPWQQFATGELEQQRLALLLATALHARLEQYMAAGEPAQFIDCLAQASRQGWLGDLSRRQAFQVHVLTLLLDNEDWPPALFVGICQVFAWDAPGATPPIPDEHWQALHRRCEQRTWIDALRALAARREQQPSPQANAAALFLLVQQPEQQRELAAGFVEADWQACERLSDAFSSRFADLLGMFPMHDPWFWKRLVEPRDPPYGIKRTTAVLTLTLALQSLPGAGLAVMLLILPLYALAALLGAYVGKWLLGLWFDIAESLHDLDQRLSAECVRRNLTRDRRLLVIRNAGPLIGLGLVIGLWLGWLGLATYLLTGVIGVLQPADMAPQDRQYRWRRPLQAIYRIAGLSWLQWLFCAAMVGVIGYLRLQGVSL
ncbi:J domain-containing protein [Pseudomonas sp. S31]|uniref:J domain-containing protein n=1 Tax=Pseudomonas sp. S31 TaxID=1564473 RepID=UPI0019147DB7|nr:J domain-containing protein [Pseudomonas sp. S31]MBK5000642.1 J domain-containing protein [Pseudomonas sp. S31]